MKNYKIAILSYRSAPFSGGQGIYVTELSNALSRLGHEVTVYSGPPYPNLNLKVKLEQYPGLDLFSTFNFYDRKEKFFKKKNKTFDDYYEFFVTLFGGFPEMRTFGNRMSVIDFQNNYDFVIDNQSLSFGMIDIQKYIPFAEVIHHPVVIDKNYELQYSNGIIKKLLIFSWYSFLGMHRKVAPQINQVITPSLNSKKDIEKYLNVNSENIDVIPNGIDTETFEPKSNIEKDSFRLITTASADIPLKGLDFTLNALSTLKDIYPKIKLVVIGNPRSGGHTDRLISKLDLNDRVSFKTNLTKSEIASEYARSNIAIVSSLYEGFGFPVGEAMACEIPLIATNVASIPEITSEYAELIEPADSIGIANAVKKIFTDYDKYLLKARNGRIHIIKNFSWLVIAQKYESLITRKINAHL
ncbi:glycosyltransferase family 4 protein [SAR86 cluster bacterium]|nr:glycosyltransferase family 4 protein [SAR86 cluster bacterium]